MPRSRRIEAGYTDKELELYRLLGPDASPRSPAGGDGDPAKRGITPLAPRRHREGISEDVSAPEGDRRDLAGLEGERFVLRDVEGAPARTGGGELGLAPEDLPLLTSADAETLLDLIDKCPDEMLDGRLVDARVERAQVISALEQVRAQFDSPGAVKNLLEAEALMVRAAKTLPASFASAEGFPNFDRAITADVSSFNVGNRRFETVGDLLGWIRHSAAAKLFPSENRIAAIREFRWHYDRSASATSYTYPLRSTASGGPVEIGLFADFGTGLVHSRYIARLLEQRAPAYAIHLGDVYYAGRKNEFAEYFNAPLRQVKKQSALFTLAGNHEQFSGNRWYWEEIRQRRGIVLPNGERQPQEGSYFRLLGDRFQLIGIDTNTFDLERYRNPTLQDWLMRTLLEGRARSLTNILLSSEHAHDYVESNKPGRLHADLAGIVGPGGERIFHDRLIDLWFWGHVHYAAFFSPAKEKNHDFSFFGSCIGHGGYPYQRVVRPNRPWVRWVETSSRYPPRTGVRPELGNNGLCMMRLERDGVRLSYLDWMGYRRCEVSLQRSPDGRLHLAEGGVVAFAPETR